MSRVSLLLPEWRRCLSDDVITGGTLARWNARADHLPTAQPGLESALRAVFDWPGKGFPVAALSRHTDAADAAGAMWLRADPAHVRADMTTARMLACGEMGVADDERAALTDALRPLFGDSGFIFEATTPTRWYLRAQLDSPMPECADPDTVVGDDLKLHLPAGVAGKRWRLLLNETQMLLHAHPVNLAREARGAVTVNSVWFWGGGTLPDWVRSEHDAVRSEDAVIVALADLAGVRVGAADAAFGGDAAAELIDLHTLRGQALQQQGLAPAQQALARGDVDQLDLLFLSGERMRVRRSHDWRFWRRTPLLTT